LRRANVSPLYPGPQPLAVVSAGSARLAKRRADPRSSITVKSGSGLSPACFDHCLDAMRGRPEEVLRPRQEC